MWFSMGSNLVFIIPSMCSEQVLGVKNARHKKYNSFEQVVRDFNASVGALPPPPNLFQPQTGATMAPVHGKNVMPPVHGKNVSWNTMIIVTFLLLVFGLWIKLSVCSKCNCSS